MLKVTADSNIYISALHFGGTPARVLELARVKAIQLAISGAILSEITRVLREKFGWAEEPLSQAIEQITAFTDLVEPQVQVQTVIEDPTDNRILECALTAGSDYLITGDKHLLHLEQHASVKILTAAEFLRVFESLRA